MFKKQLEIVSVIFTVCFISIIPVIAYPLLLYLLYLGSYPRYFAIAYIIHLYFDWDSKNGERRHADWLINSCYGKSIQSYFSMSMEAEAQIPQNKNYIVVMHPHGVVSFGSFIRFFKQDKNYKKVYGNGKAAFCTAHYNLEIPFQRDFFFLLKSINASASCILNWLSRKNVAHYACLYVGGSEEALLSRPNVHKVILKKRKGFCRLAIQSGADLIPCYTFGETELWDTVAVEENSIIYKIQRLIHKYFNVGLPLVKGEWKYQYLFVLPKRKKLTQVYGRPVQVKQNDNPTKEEINELHDRYCKALVRLFDKNKLKYLSDRNAKLIIQ